MKKVYIKPEVIVTLLNVESQLLAGSPNGNDSQPTPGGGSQTPGGGTDQGWAGMSRDTHGIWVDVWED